MLVEHCSPEKILNGKIWVALGSIFDFRLSLKVGSPFLDISTQITAQKFDGIRNRF
jgi:hypothetical protein